ncbi:MAG: plasma-membrane proton-efflux P-type ATPase [Ktedonobacteraceae bacterium]
MTSPSQHAKSRPSTKQAAITSLSLTELQAHLAATLDGLSAAEATKRLDHDGYNELAEKRVNPFLRLFASFWGPIPWMIEIAAILSLVIRHWADFVIILVLLVMNAAVGFWEEYQANTTIAALKKHLALHARVKRDGAWVTLPSRELAPGDRVHLDIGEIIPADARLLEGDPIEVDQSALTGESLPVTRKVGENVYSGALVKRGEMDALVYATGQDTYFGATAKLVEKAHTTSHFQRAVLKIGDYLIVLAVSLVILILIAALIRHDDLLTTLQFALVLTIAAVPVAMPTVLSVTMAVGARILAHKQAVVSRLAAIEELAGIDVLCSDKTGTLTQNKLVLGTPSCVTATDPHQVIFAAALASRSEGQDPIDMAILGGVAKEQQQDISQHYQVTHFQPFDPVHKRTEATVKGPNGQTFRVAKGAPQVIQALSAAPEKSQAQVDQAIHDFAQRGYRALGVARMDEQQWQVLGVLPLYDPLRDDSKATVATAKKMGVQIKMVTGDQLAIATEISSELGLGTHIQDAALFSSTPTDQANQFAETIEHADGFAQVFPEHKYAIVEALQKRGHIVGMTGDGVNDAPALKKADAGIAVSGATDAARSAASVILLTPGLSVIIDAIKEGRKTFQRMNSYAIYRITETIRVLLFMTLSILIFNFYPVTAIMIVLLAVLNDGAILSIAYDRVHYSNKPEAWNMPKVLSLASTLGLLGVLETFGLLYLATTVFHLNRDLIQTLIYLKLSVSGHLTIFVTRTRGPFWSIRPASVLLIAVICTQLLATLITVYGLFMSPIGWTLALFVWGYALFWFLVEDRLKLVVYHILDRHPAGVVALFRKHRVVKKA